MALIQSIACVVPAYEIPQTSVQSLVRERFAPAFPTIDRYMSVFRHSAIDTRWMARPLEWWNEPRSFGERNRVFIEEALVLGCKAIEECLAASGLTPQDIDHLFVVTTTGLAAPSLDALLIHELQMKRHIRRTPLWGLGCAGGLGGLARASEYVRAEPTHHALLVNIEFCSLTYLPSDFSKRNLIATSLFSDGVTAVLISGEQTKRLPQLPQARVVDTLSTLYPDSAEIMGWQVVDDGFEVVFSSRIPSIIREEFVPLVDQFLARRGLDRLRISRFLLHPGGAKVITAYQAALNLTDEELAVPSDILRRYGNMSSSTIFFVFDETLRQKPLATGEYALGAVFGPGFSAELVLLQGIDR